MSDARNEAAQAAVDVLEIDQVVYSVVGAILQVPDAVFRARSGSDTPKYSACPL